MDKKTIAGSVFLVAALLVGLAVPVPGFAGGREESGEKTLGVFVSIQPQSYFIERIGGERIRVETLVKPGQDPHTFEPTPQQMARLAEAKAFFRIGVEYENPLMPRIESTMKGIVVVDCREGIHLRKMETQGHDEAEQEGEEHEEEYGGTDPHVWLSVRNAIRIAGTMRDALVELDPEGKDSYDRGHDQLIEDLQALDRRIAAILAPVKGRRFFVFHPSFGYFADDYGLEQIAVQIGGAEPSARQLARLIEEAKTTGVRVIFVQPQFSQKSAETIAAEIGGAVVPIDSLARDYIDNLERMARAIEEGLQ
ncbi:MAG: zinc ABC transporter substrate-binding protein [Spirochaetaceae bacterium]|nr:MAG: zinc ABC transporter substrate-binding protein [Spirochaetaceae bacterium]